MAIYKALRSLIRKPNTKSSSLLPFSFSPFSSALSPSRLPPSLPGGPLFLSCTPWKLSQLATPFFLRGKGAPFAQDLIQLRSFPVRLAMTPSLDLTGWKERGSVGGDVRADEKFLNLPNLISIARMVSGPFIGWMILQEWYLPAFGALAISGATDWLDGYVARRMNINSVFGSYLDPLADKVLIGCVAVAMVKNDLLHPGLVGLVVFRDVALVSGALYKRASNLKWKWNSWSEFTNLDAIHQEKVEPLLISKVNTVFQLFLVAAALLQPEFGTEQSQVYVTYLSWLVATTTMTSSVAYLTKYLKYK